MRLFSAPTSPIIAHRRRALVARHPVVARLIDRSEHLCARAMPSTPDDAADLLAELVMIHAVEKMIAAEDLDEDRAVLLAIETLISEILGGDLLVVLARHVDEAMRRIPHGFSQRLLAATAGLHWRMPNSCLSIPSRRYLHCSSGRGPAPSISDAER